MPPRSSAAKRTAKRTNWCAKHEDKRQAHQAKYMLMETAQNRLKAADTIVQKGIANKRRLLAASRSSLEFMHVQEGELDTWLNARAKAAAEPACMKAPTTATACESKQRLQEQRAQIFTAPRMSRKAAAASEVHTLHASACARLIFLLL